ncbi:unnamed protein product, partial [Musa textilis]
GIVAEARALWPRCSSSFAAEAWLGLCDRGVAWALWPRLGLYGRGVARALRP